MGSSFIVITASGFATWRRGFHGIDKRREKQDCSKHSAWGFAESLKKGGRSLSGPLGTCNVHICQ